MKRLLVCLVLAAPAAAVAQVAAAAAARAEAFVWRSGWQVLRATERAGRPNTQVNFGDRPVADAGLKELAGLAHVRGLNLYGTRLTDAGVAELRRALPRCDVVI